MQTQIISSNAKQLSLLIKDNDSKQINVYRFDNAEAFHARDFSQSHTLYSGTYTPHANLALKSGRPIESVLRLNISLNPTELAVLDKMADFYCGGNRSKMLSTLIEQAQSKFAADAE